MKIDANFPSPSLFDHVITAIPQGDSFVFLDTTPELAVYGYLLSSLRDKEALIVPSSEAAQLVRTPKDPPGANGEDFHMEASLDSDGTLEGKSRLDSHGDSELILRSAFRATSESQWKELVQRISGGMGFGGTVSDVLVAQPEAVGQPFWFSYSYHRPEYSNWKEHQISLPVPPLALPALAEKRKTLTEPVSLGVPIELMYEAKVKLPKGMRALLPRNVSVEEDFASYTATYSFQDGVLGGVRRLKIRVNELPGSKRATYSRFVDSLLEDQGHYIPVTMEGGEMGGMPKPPGNSEKLDLNGSAARLNALAYSLAEAGHGLKDALHYAEEAVKETELHSVKTDLLDTSNTGVTASLSAEWDTLGWVKFRLGDYEGATKYLEAAWRLMQVPIIGDHLGQAYEKSGKKQQAAETYGMALNALGQKGDAALRQRMTARLTFLTAHGAAVNGNTSGDDLSAMRAYRVSSIKEWGGGYKTATFGIALTGGPDAPFVWFLSGADELKDSGVELAKIKFKISFPDDGPTRIVQQGILTCSEVTKYCKLILLPMAERDVPSVTP